MIDRELFYFNLEVESRDELLKIVGSSLQNKGFVKETYVEALLEREHNFPTGLPLKIGVAIPHTSIEHANENKLVFVKPTHSLTFNEMGNEDGVVEVEFIIFLVICDEKDHMDVLSKIITIIQEEKIVENILKSESLVEFQKKIINAFDIKVEGK